MKEIPVSVSLPKLEVESETRAVIKEYIAASREPKRYRVELDENVSAALTKVTTAVAIVSVTSLLAKVAIALISSKSGGSR